MGNDPRLTVLCEYPDTGLAPTEITFGLSPRYGIFTARDSHDWFLKMMWVHEEFEVETDRAPERARKKTYVFITQSRNWQGKLR